MKPLRFAVTPGEPAGIGPDLCLLLAADAQPHPLIAITSRDLLAERATQLGLAVNLLPVAPGLWPEQPAPAGSLYVWDTPLAAPVVPGQLDKAKLTLNRGLGMAQKHNDVPKVISTHDTLAQIAQAGGDVGNAKQHLTAAIDLAQKANMKDARRTLRKKLETLS